MAAVLILIFQDTLLSLVASVQISSNDIVRVGDWVEMPQLNADGDLAERGNEPVNTRRITNIGTFRAYAECYLRNHLGVRQDLHLVVRQLEPTSDGLPLEIYCFTNTTAWPAYEGIQSDIFDHLLAILPEFGLRVFQHPSGADMRDMGMRAGAAGDFDS